LIAVCKNEIASINNQKNLYSNGAEFEDDEHLFSSDLDIFGPASLFNLVDRCATPVGRAKLASWFQQPATELEINFRQQSVKEIGEKLDWAQRFKTILLPSKDADAKDLTNLMTYFQQENDPNSAWLKSYVKAVPFAILASALIAWFFTPAVLLVILFLVFNSFLVIINQPKVNKTDSLLNKVSNTLSAYAIAFNHIEKENWTSDFCKFNRDQLKISDTSSFSSELKSLAALLSKLEYRLNMFVGPILNGVLAWDLRQIIAIEDWRKKNRQLIFQAFESLATFESLVSLSSLHSNYPKWCFPNIEEDPDYTYDASNLSHPLIPAAVRIENDYSLKNTRKVDIITGSNMAGKSTFLRTLGINAVLAFAGAPVCASQMKITVMHFFAYMRIRDSLNESTSTFKAELNRLQMLLATLNIHKKVFFLVDEMLRGTNSVDKYLGSKAVIEKLISERAVGIIATHDLQIAELETKYPEYVRNFYFDIQIAEGEMLFDYKLKDGKCTTFNASILLKQIGIDINSYD
jgi:DNA mismatch repair ATPase MutS